MTYPLTPTRSIRMVPPAASRFVLPPSVVDAGQRHTPAVAAVPTVPAIPVLTEIPDVELLYAGTWETSTGQFTWTPDHIASAVAAVDDPAIHAPFLKIGHTSVWGDGEPAMGLVRNLRTNANGTVLLGDFVGVPAWLAAVMPFAWPGRSIEGWFDWSTANMGVHPFVLEAVAMLGVVAGAVETLSELPVMFSDSAPPGTTVDGTPVEELADAA